MPRLTPDYVAPSWLVGPHMQTIIPATMGDLPQVQYRRERWTTPDDDFLDVDWVCPEVQDEAAPVLIHFHGLEGSSHSHYALALMRATADRGWRGCVAHFRSCSGELNRKMRSYHAGDTAEVMFVIKTVKTRYPKAPIYLVGVSLGGNQVARFLGEQGEAACQLVTAACSVSSPVDLVAGSNLIRHGFNRLYAYRFLRTLIPKVEQKCRQFPQLARMIDVQKIRHCKSFYEFDSLYTAPVHGFKNAMQYWTQCSAKPVLKDVRVPLLLLNAKNDPFLPRWALPQENDVSEMVWLDQPEDGGHVGFARGHVPMDLTYLPERIFRFFDFRR